MLPRLVHRSTVLHARVGQVMWLAPGAVRTATREVDEPVTGTAAGSDLRRGPPCRSS